jgi:hypothetical protein
VSLEKRVPKTIIQEGKKGIRGLMVVFREILGVTRGCGKHEAEGIVEFRGIVAE